jgi:hypothetical protein
MRRVVFQLLAGLAIAAVLVGTEATPTIARPLAPASWSTAGFLDHQPPYGGGAPPAGLAPLSGISCPTASLCVAVDARGNVVTSTRPSAGPAGWHVTHTAAQVFPITPAIQAVTCPSTSLCVAVDAGGDVLASTDPTGAGSSWRVTRVESGTGGPPFVGATLTAVSCPSTSLCVAADRNGSILTSTSPSRGPWRAVDVDSKPGFFGITAISCATSSFCAAVDGAGNVITSTHPTGGASAWRLRNIDGSKTLFGISCASASMCVAVDDTAALASTNPTGGTTAWQRAIVDRTTNHMNAVTCPSAAMCVAVDQSGNVVTSGDPTGGASAWRADSIDASSLFTGGIPPLSGLTGVSCPSTSFCAAVDTSGNLAKSTNPTGGAGAWTVEQIDGSNGPDGLTCPSGGCVAIDQAGNVLTSADPADPSSWTIRAVDQAAGTTGGIGAVSCPSASFCAAVDGGASVLAAANPLTGSSWTVTSVDPGHTLASVSCPSSSLCIAVDEAGNAAVSTNPEGASPTWVVSHIDDDVTSTGAQAALDDVSCPSVALCVAVDSAGDVLTSTNPAGGPAAWTTSAVAGGTDLSAVSCPSTSLCLAVGGSTMLVSRGPAAGAQSWVQSTLPLPAQNSLGRISCAGVWLCIAPDYGGDVLSSDDPAGGGPTWKVTHVDLYGIPAAACAPVDRCFAINGVGNLLVGRQPSLHELLDHPLRAAAIPAPAARRIGPLLARDGYRLTFAAPFPGSLSITWRLKGTGATVAAVRVKFTGTAPQTVQVALTPAGRRLLRRDRRLPRRARRPRVVARATFVPSGGRPVAAAGTFSVIR